MRTTLRRSRSAVARAVELGAIEQYAKIGGRAAWSGAQLQQSPWWGCAATFPSHTCVRALVLSSTVVCVGIMLGGRSLPRTLTSSTLPSRWPCARAPSSGTERYRWQSAATCSRCGRMGWAACFEARAELSLPPPFFAREHSPRNSPPHGRSRPHLQASPSPTDPPRATSRSPLSTLTRCATLTNQLLPAAGLAEELEDGTGATMLQARAVGQRRTAAERGEGQERAGGDRATDGRATRAAA